MKEHQIESDKVQRENNKFKQDSEMLKNFDKEFIRITKHRDLLDEEINELKKKHQTELRQIREEVENEIKKRILRLDDDKKLEYDFLTENLRKNLKSLEKVNEELKSTCFDLENKLKIAKEGNDNLVEQLEAKIKSLKILSNKIDDKENIITILKYHKYIYISAKNYQQAKKS